MFCDPIQSPWWKRPNSLAWNQSEMSAWNSIKWFGWQWLWVKAFEPFAAIDNSLNSWIYDVCVFRAVFRSLSTLSDWPALHALVLFRTIVIFVIASYLQTNNNDVKYALRTLYFIVGRLLGNVAHTNQTRAEEHTGEIERWNCVEIRAMHRSNIWWANTHVTWKRTWTSVNLRTASGSDAQRVSIKCAAIASWHQIALKVPSTAPTKQRRISWKRAEIFDNIIVLRG